MSIYVDLVPWPFLVGGFKRFFEITLNIAGKQQILHQLNWEKILFQTLPFSDFEDGLLQFLTRRHDPTTPRPRPRAPYMHGHQHREVSAPHLSTRTSGSHAIREARRGNGVLHQSWCAICPEVMHIRNESK